MIIPVILAGGSGTRLWPLSRRLYPKQFLELSGDRTMFQSTLLRLNNDPDAFGDPIVLCNESHRFMVAEQLREISIRAAALILEPVGRNTAPAVGAAALKALALDTDPTLLVLPADHVIKNVDEFLRALQIARQYADLGHLITFGILPDAPETGYGYIRKGDSIALPGISRSDIKDGVFAIDEFVEKPDLKTAKEYLASNDYCWNSGMFMFKAASVLEELKKYSPDIVSPCEKALKLGMEDLDFFRLDAEAFKSCKSESIDYAVMEKTQKGVMVELDAGWNDLGSWEALWQIEEKDENKNVIHGDVIFHDVKNSLLHASNRLVAAVGLEGHVVIETADAVLISPRDRVQDVKTLVEKLKSDKREEVNAHRKVYRPWGAYENIDISERFQVKRITVNPGCKLSLQKHFHRAEHWVVVSGAALVTKGDEEHFLGEDESIYIAIGETHRLQNPGKIPLELIEVQSGSYLAEDDIVRFEDLYGREVDE